MAYIPPAPPPPLPPAIKNNELRPTRSIEYKEDKCLHNLDLFFNKSITTIQHVPQTGPNCGLAALAMVSMLTPHNMALVDIFNEAKSRGYTNNGEMFSVKNMAMLAESVLSPWLQVEMFIDGLTNNKTLIIERLYDGDLMLIPYDADKNHSPCCVGGHKAHWALVCGVMITGDGEYCVAARHGKSRHLAVWPLDSLCHSNDNLSELDPARVSDGCDYLLPPGGLLSGLASKFILLHKNRC